MKNYRYLVFFLIVLVGVSSMAFSAAHARRLTGTFNRAAYSSFPKIRTNYYSQRQTFRQPKFKQFNTVRNQRINTRQIQQKKIKIRQQQVTAKRELRAKQSHARITKRNTAIAKREKAATKRKEIIKQNQLNRVKRVVQQKRRLNWLKDRQARKRLADKQKKNVDSALTVSTLMRNFRQSSSISKTSLKPVTQNKTLQDFKKFRAGQAGLQRTSKGLEYQRQSIKERFNRLAQQRAVTNSQKLKPDRKKELTETQKLALNNFSAGKAYKHGYKYHPRVRSRGLEDPKAHNFPYSFDDAILKRKPMRQSDGSLLYKKSGTLNGKQGYYEIAINPRTKTIFHRTFVGKK